MPRATGDRTHTDASQQPIHRVLAIDETGVRIHYADYHPPASAAAKGVILLIHGFPQTSYQFRHVLEPLSEAGYRVIAPDYRGAGKSSHPKDGFTKSIMAADLFHLIHDHLGIRNKIHLIGHDIGGMVAHAYVCRYSDHVASIIWGECPLPGTSTYEKHKANPAQFHFMFHAVPDLPEALVAGRELIYLRHFFDKQSYNSGAISNADFDHYVADYSQPGALRCAFAVYAAFETDAKENTEALKAAGRITVPALGLTGDRSHHSPEETEQMLGEIYETFETAVVENSAHYIAEENPTDFVQKVLAFVRRYP